MIIDKRILVAALTLFSEQLRASGEASDVSATDTDAILDIYYQVALIKDKLAYRSDMLTISDVKVLLPGEKLPTD